MLKLNHVFWGAIFSKASNFQNNDKNNQKFNYFNYIKMFYFHRSKMLV